MKIICGLGTAVRFALLCIILGMVLGFVLGVRVHTESAPVQAITDRPSPAAALNPEADAPARQPVAVAGDRARLAGQAAARRRPPGRDDTDCSTRQRPLQPGPRTGGGPAGA